MKLQEARKKARFTQQQVADRLGVSRPTYAKMETDSGLVTVDDAKRLAKLYGVEVSDIFFDPTYS